MKVSQVHILEFIGAIGIILSLVFLAYENRQANQIARATIAYEIGNNYSEFNQSIYENADVVELFANLREPDYQLNPVEYERALLIAYRFINVWISVEQGHRNGMFDDSVLEQTYIEIESNYNLRPSMRPVWKEMLELNQTAEYFLVSSYLNELILTDTKSSE